jgi:S1-C subfamily serine protease
VIGINTLVVRSTNDGNVAEGLGFAIPAEQVRQIMTQLVASGHVDRPFMGVSYQNLDPQIASALNLTITDGVVVTQVDPGTPAAQAGLQQGDVITQFDSQKIDQDHSLQNLLFTRKVGDTVTLTIMRSGKPMTVKLTLILRPSS